MSELLLVINKRGNGTSIVPASLPMDTRFIRDVFSDEKIELEILHHGALLRSAIYVSNDGRYTVAIEGIAQVPTSGAKGLLQDILDGYLREGVDFLLKLNGAYNLIIWDRFESRLRFVTDRFGLRPSFVASFGGGVYIGSSPSRMLQAAKAEPVLNEKTVYNMLSYSRVFAGTGTLFEGVEAIQPASILTITGSSVTRQKYWELTFDPQYGKTQELVEDTAQCLSQAVNNALHPHDRCALNLSGGLDSRVIAAAADENERARFRAYTWGFSAACSEVSIARDVAESLSIKWEFLKVEPEEFLSRAGEGVGYLDGQDLAVQSYGLSVYPRVAEQCAVGMTGLAFDVLAGGSYSSGLNHEGAQDFVKAESQIVDGLFYFKGQSEFMFCDSSVAQENIELVREELARNFAAGSSGSVMDSADSFILKQRAWRVIFPRQRWQRLYIDDLVPTFDNEVVRTLTRIPPEQRANHRFLRSLLRELDPVSYQLPYQRTLLPVSAPVEFWKKAAELENKREALLREVYRATNGKVIVPYNRYYSNFDEWIRTNNYWREFFENSVLAHDSRVCAKFLRRGWLENKYAEHMTGAESHHNVLVLVLSLELALRRFFD